MYDMTSLHIYQAIDPNPNPCDLKGVCCMCCRAVLLKLASVAVLMIVLYTQFYSHQCNQVMLSFKYFTWSYRHNDVSLELCMMFIWHAVFNVPRVLWVLRLSNDFLFFKCWENQIGAQMFNLIWIDFFVIIGTTICGETARKWVLFMRLVSVVHSLPCSPFLGLSSCLITPFIVNTLHLQVH